MSEWKLIYLILHLQFIFIIFYDLTVIQWGIVFLIILNWWYRRVIWKYPLKDGRGARLKWSGRYNAPFTYECFQFWCCAKQRGRKRGSLPWRRIRSHSDTLSTLHCSLRILLAGCSFGTRWRKELARAHFLHSQKRISRLLLDFWRSYSFPTIAHPLPPISSTDNHSKPPY